LSSPCLGLRGGAWCASLTPIPPIGSFERAPLEPSPELRAFALRAAQAVGADYAGVDILPIVGGGYTVVEVNGIPGWRGLQRATGVDVAERLVVYALGAESGA